MIQFAMGVHTCAPKRRLDILFVKSFPCAEIFKTRYALALILNESRRMAVLCFPKFLLTHGESRIKFISCVVLMFLLLCYSSRSVHGL